MGFNLGKTSFKNVCFSFGVQNISVNMDSKGKLDKTSSEVYERIIKARFHLWVLQNYDGQWLEVAAQVKAVTGVAIPAESLRQNIMPVSKKSGIPPRRFKDKSKVEALKNFLISVNYLDQQELETDNFSNYAAIAFSNFIHTERDVLSFSKLEKLKGQYICDQISPDYSEHLELQIHYSSHNKTVNVREISLFDEGEYSELEDEIIHNGWAVCTENGFYMIILHSKEEQSTKCYLIMQSSPSISSNKTINDMALMSYQSAWTGELSKISNEIEGIKYSLPQKIEDLCLFFTRV